MDGITSSSAAGQADEGGSPDLYSMLSGQAALSNAAAAAPDIGYAAGSNAVQGAIDALTPYLPYLLIGAVALVIMLKR